MKEEGVGINCSELRQTGQGSRIQEGTASQEGLAVRTPWRCSSQLTALPQPSSVPSGSSGCQGSGDWRGALGLPGAQLASSRCCWGGRLCGFCGRLRNS